MKITKNSKMVANGKTVSLVAGDSILVEAEEQMPEKDGLADIEAEFARIEAEDAARAKVKRDKAEAKAAAKAAKAAAKAAEAEKSKIGSTIPPEIIQKALELRSKTEPEVEPEQAEPDAFAAFGMQDEPGEMAEVGAPEGDVAFPAELGDIIKQAEKQRQEQKIAEVKAEDAVDVNITNDNYKFEDRKSETEKVIISSDVLTEMEKQDKTDNRIVELNKLLGKYPIKSKQKYNVDNYNPEQVDWSEWSDEDKIEYNKLIFAIKFDRLNKWSAEDKGETKFDVDTYAMNMVPIYLWPEIRFDSKYTVRQLIKELLKSKDDPFRWYKCVVLDKIETSDGSLYPNPLGALQKAFNLTLSYYNNDNTEQGQKEFLEFFETYFEHNSITPVGKAMMNKFLVVVNIKGIGSKVMPYEASKESPYNSYKGIVNNWGKIKGIYNKVWESIPSELRPDDGFKDADQATAYLEELWGELISNNAALMNKIIQQCFPTVDINPQDDEDKEVYKNAMSTVLKSIKWAINPVDPKTNEVPVSLAKEKGAIVKARLSFGPKSSRRQESDGSLHHVAGKLNNAVVNVLSSLDTKKPEDIDINAIAKLAIPIGYYKSVAFPEHLKSNEQDKTYLPGWDDTQLLTLERLFRSSLPPASEMKSPNREEWDRNFAEGGMYQSKTASPSGKSRLGEFQLYSQTEGDAYRNQKTDEIRLIPNEELEALKAQLGSKFDEYWKPVRQTRLSGELEKLEGAVDGAKQIQGLFKKYDTNDVASLKTAMTDRQDVAIFNKMISNIKGAASNSESNVVESINGIITNPTTIVVNNSAFKLNRGDRLIIDSVRN